MKNNLLKSWRLFLATIMLLSLGITSAWGAPALTNVPTGTFTLPTFEDEWTWNSVIDNPYEVSGNYIVFNANVLYQSAKSNNQPWIKLIGGGTSSADWTAPESTPFVGSANWKKAENAVNTYATVKTESDRVFYFRVTNCVGAKALVKSGSNKKRTIYLDAYELTKGVAESTATKTASMESSTMDVISITGLDAEKEYLIVVYSICSGSGGSSSGNSNFFEMAFEKPAAASYAVTFTGTAENGTFAVQNGSTSLTTGATISSGTELSLVATPVSGYELDAWDVYKTGDATTKVTVTNNKFTMPAYAVTIAASFKVAVAKYTVDYYDGSTKLGSEQVEVGSHPTASEITTTKAHYTFNSWQKDGADIELNTVSAAADATVTLTARYTAIYSQSFDFGATTDLKKDNIASKLTAVGITSGIGTSGSYDAGGTAGYLGYKFKNSGDWIEMLLEDGKFAVVTYGYTESGWKVNGADAGVSTKAKTYVNKVYTASGSDAIYKLVNQSADSKTSVLTKILISSPFTVTYTAGEGATAARTSDTFNGTDLTLPTATKGDDNFEGWYDAATDGNKIGNAGDSYSPTAAIELFAHFSTYKHAVGLATLKYGAEEASATSIAVVADQTTYNVLLPYGSSYPNVYATVPAADNSTLGEITQANAETKKATFTVTAEDGTTKANYTINFTIAPKIGVEIVKAALKGGETSPEMTGLYAGAGAAKTQSLDKTNGGYKLGSIGHYVSLSLNGENKFQEGDVIAIKADYLNGGNKATIYDAVAGTKLFEFNLVTGLNYYTMPVAVADKATLVLYRADATCNPNISFVAVYRVMPSIIKSFKIGEVNGVIDQDAKTIAVELPNGTDVTSLTPTVEAYANGGATLNLTGAQDFTSPKTYTVTSAYAEDAAVSYVVTVNVAAPACPTEVTITGTTTYTDGETITLNAATNGSGTLSYQWKIDGTAIAGATAATFTKTATMADAGDYTCTVSQSEGSCEFTSAATTVTVNKKAVTKVEVAGETRVKIGESITLTATVTPADATYPTVTWSSEGSPVYFTFADVNANPAIVTGARVGATKNVYAEADGKKSSGYKVTCYAVVTYNTNGGVAIADAEYDGSSAISLPTPTGGTEPFLGWYTDAEYTNKAGNAGASYKPATNVTLYAKWTLPDAETPVITTQPVGATYDEGDAMTPLTVVVDPVSDGGTLSYQWYKGTTEVGSNSASYTPTEAGTYKVVVTNTLADHNPVSTTSENAVITVNYAYTQLDVTGDMTWDFTNKGAADAQVNGVNDGAYYLLANCSGVKSSFKGQYMTADFNKITTGNIQGKGLKFHTTVDGFVTVEFSNTGTKDNYRILYVNGEETTAKSKNTTHVTYTQFVEAGDVVLTAFEETASWNMLNFYKVTFSTGEQIRNGLTAGNFGTMCQAKAIEKIGGAIVYEIENTNPIGIDLVEAELPLIAGKPYIYQATHSEVRVIYAAGDAATSVAEANGLVGNLSTAGGTISIPLNSYVIQHNNLCKVVSSMNLPADRAYIDYDAIVDNSGAAAPSRRRVTMGGAQTDTPTDIDEVSSENSATKFIENGILYILRDGKIYNAQGQLVK